MCQFKSMVVCRERILYSKKHDNHRRLLEESGIRDDSLNPDFVKIELVPRNRDYGNLGTYAFRIDQDNVPEWWNAEWAESECRDVLKKIMSNYPKEFPGDLIIDSNAKPDALKTVGGNLDIYSDVKFDAPLLKTVGGNLDIYSNVKLDALKTVGGDLVIGSGVKFDAPLLKTVGGNLYIYSDVKLDAPQLTTVNKKPYVKL